MAGIPTPQRLSPYRKRHCSSHTTFQETSAFGVLFDELAADTKRTKKLLEIGTGTGLIAFRLSGKVPEITAIDLSPGMIKVAERKRTEPAVTNIDFRIGNASCLEFKAKSFDTIIASNIMHLLANPVLALREMKRVLKDDGRIIVPTYCHGETIKSGLVSR